MSGLREGLVCLGLREGTGVSGVCLFLVVMEFPFG